ncbi:uncharacterized protein LOC135207177 [Macrobrachium nipponense]|uniref:uncharacterized protein LOC135207177 n=1 Tax=Macrobrachium nipponense TaxID=159736 RepID=UPI0030C80A5F
MDLKILLVIAVAICLKMDTSAGSIYHSPRHQCIPPLVRLLPPTVYYVSGVSICGLICSQTSCLFYEFTETDGTCKIHGIGMEPTNVYVNTDAAAPPEGGPLREKAKAQPTYPQPSMLNASLAIDDNMTTHWENGWVKPWWMVDLGAYYIIHHVNILPRQGYFSFRFQEVEIRAGPELKTDADLTTWEFIGFYPGIYQDGGGRLTFNHTQGVCGRFLSVQRINALSDTLALADVLVYVRQNATY